ncbi:MAG: SCO family protein [Rhodospirillales bacterium]
MAKPAKPKADREADPSVETGKPFLQRRVGLLAVVVVLFAVAFAGWQYYRQAAEKPQAQAPAIGGPFSLVDQEGRPVTDAYFKGRFMLVYFGYTFCPDICPTQLTEMGNALDLLGPVADKVTPVFITVDPERDRPEHLKEYLTFFHPRMVGLTGTPEQIKAAAKAYKVYYKKSESEGEDPDDYLMDHTSVTYLMGPDGAFIAHFSHDTGTEAMAARLREFL